MNDKCLNSTKTENEKMLKEFSSLTIAVQSIPVGNVENNEEEKNRPKLVFILSFMCSVFF